MFFLVENMVNDNSNYNADELHAPDWLNKYFIEKIIRNAEQKSAVIKLDDYKITPGTSKSDHYASVMFRICAHYTLQDAQGTQQQKQQSMILKANTEIDGQKKELTQDMHLFETEIRMYSETLPKIEAILHKNGDDTKLSAKVLYYELEPKKVIVFEDLVVKGYAAIPNRACTLDEVKNALAKVARLHAVSFKLAQEGDSSITSYKKGSFNSVDVFEFEATKNAIEIFKEAIAEQEDLKMYIPHVEKIEKDLLNKCVNSFNAYQNGDHKGILVLNHGDFHIKNLMVQYEGKKLKDLMLLDYQISIFGSIALDVLYATVMLFGPDMRRNHRDELLYYYYTNFKQTLKLIEYANHIPTYKELRDELNRVKHWEIFLNIAFLLFNREFLHPDGNIAKVVEDTEYRKKLLRTADIQDQLRFILPRLLHQGYFED